MLEVTNDIRLSKEEVEKLIVASETNTLFLEIEIKFFDGKSKFIYKRACVSLEPTLRIIPLKKSEIVGNEELLGDNDNAQIITRYVIKRNISETITVNGREFTNTEENVERIHTMPDVDRGYITKGDSWIFHERKE